MDNKAYTRIYTKIICGIAIGIILVSLLIFKVVLNWQNILFSLIMGIGMIVADKYPVVYFPEKENQAEITLSLALTFATAFILSPTYAILTVALANMVAEIITKKNNFSQKQKKTKIIFNTAYLSIVAGITSIFFHIFYNTQLGFLSLYNIEILLFCGLVYFLTETFILFGLLSHLNNESFIKYWKKNVKAVRLEFLTLFPLGYLLIYLYIKNFWVATLLIPLFVAIYFASKEKAENIRQTEKTLFTLAAIEDDKFPDTKKHSDRVGNLTKRLCKKLNMGEDEMDIIVKAAKLHDIGKIAVPDWILEKPDKLTEEEFEKIKQHSKKGKEIVANLGMFKSGSLIILHHHEKWDGTGYPDGLKKTEIPLGSRIIAIADSFDAMISKRPYKNPKTIKEALKEIQENKGKQFDPELADKFCELIKEIIENEKDKFLQYFPEEARID